MPKIGGFSFGQRSPASLPFQPPAATKSAFFFDGLWIFHMSRRHIDFVALDRAFENDGRTAIPWRSWMLTVGQSFDAASGPTRSGDAMRETYGIETDPRTDRFHHPAIQT